MKYYKTITLKDGRECILRHGTREDAQAVLDNFILTHTQTDFLLSYPDEIKFTAESEADLLERKEASDDSVEILAVADGKVAGLAGVDPISKAYKLKHRANFGISIDRTYWGLGIGRAMTEAAIECAKEAGYTQLELDVAEDNKTAIALYKSVGFVEYGRNPQGFNSRIDGLKGLVLMRLELK